MQEDENDTTTISKIDYSLLLPQCFIGFVDAISFMVVAPSIVFYVLSLGGTKEQYGIILSIFSFASFSFKPLLGYWSDKSGGKFRAPYMFSIAVAALGGLLYFFASAAHQSTIALVLITVGRFMGGAGAANQTLGFTYVAQVLSPDQLTRANSALSMVRVFGMGIAPALNVLLEKINGNIFGFEIDPLNSIGLVLFFTNMMSFLIVYFLLEEPSEDTNPGPMKEKSEERGDGEFWKSFFSLEIMLPVLVVLSMNANFQLLETGLAPASSNALGWTPVEISTVFGINALVMLFVIFATFYLSSKGVADIYLLIIGLLLSIVGYSCIYLLWSAHSMPWEFVIPIFLSTAAFPFLGGPTRSLYTKFIASDKHLRDFQGSMQAILSMAASVAGFVAPGLVATYILRTPDEVEDSSDQRELTPYALFAPILSLISLIGVVILMRRPERDLTDEEEDILVGERTSLLFSSAQQFYIPNSFHPKTEAHRRHSIAIMGIPQITFEPIPGEPGRHSTLF